MTDRGHLDEFGEGISEVLAKALVATFIDCYRAPSLSTADVITRLKEEMEQALDKDADSDAAA